MTHSVISHCSYKVMNRRDLGKLTCEVFRLRLGAAELATTGNKAALAERLYQHLRETSSEPEPEQDAPDAASESSEKSSKSSDEDATPEPIAEAERSPPERSPSSRGGTPTQTQDTRSEKTSSIDQLFLKRLIRLQQLGWFGSPQAQALYKTSQKEPL